MEVFLITCSRVAVMLLMMLVGAALFRTGMLTNQGSKDLAHLLLYVILPCVLIQCFQTERTPEKSRWLLYAFALSAASLGLSMLISQLLYKKSPVDNVGTAFSNAGFLGLPLLQTVLGEEAVIFSVPFIALMNVLQTTYGVSLLTKGEKKVSVGSILRNPVVLGTLLGLLLYVTGLRLPGVLTSSVSMISAMNAPVAMLILGTYLAQTDLLRAFRSGRMLRNAFPRLLLIPLATIALLSILPREMYLAKMAILIVSSAPTGTLVAVFSQLYDLDYTYACQVVCVSTLLSVLSLPFIITLAGMIW